MKDAVISHGIGDIVTHNLKKYVIIKKENINVLFFYVKKYVIQGGKK